MSSAVDFPWRMSGEELRRAIVEQFELLRREYGVALSMVAELVNQGADSDGRSPKQMLVDDVRLSRAEAQRTVERAEALHDTIGISGAPRPAALPETAVAVAEGAVSVEHLDKIRKFNNELPAGVDEDSRLAAEQALARIARTSAPQGLTRPINEFIARLDPDGAEPSEAELLHPHRELRTLWQGERFRFAGDVDRETGMLLEAVLSPLAAPRSSENERDLRSAPERYGDAFAELVHIAASSDDIPAKGGPVTILLTMNEQDLREGISAATTMDGHRIPAAQVRRAACDAGIIPTLLGKAGEVLDMGSRVRTAPMSVRNRLIVRDQGCAFPGRDRPPRHCQAHHVRHWADGGATTPGNMVLLCHQHHRAVHHSQWEVRIRDGTPEFVPPSYVDPERVPRRQPRVT